MIGIETADRSLGGIQRLTAKREAGVQNGN